MADAIDRVTTVLLHIVAPNFVLVALFITSRARLEALLVLFVALRLLLSGRW